MPATKPDSFKILIGYDGSDCARSAIRDLAKAGLPAKVDAMVLSVADIVSPSYGGFGMATDAGTIYPSPGVIDEVNRLSAHALAEARDMATAGGKLVSSLFPHWLVSSNAVSESPYWALIQESEKWGADLVVVGSHGRGALGRLVLGSVSQNVLSHAPCSVRVGRCRDAAATAGSAPQSAAEAAPRIVLAVDGSIDAATAVDAVAARRWPAGTEIQALTVVDVRWTSAAANFAVTGATNFVEMARRRVETVARHLHDDAGVIVTPVVLQGDPKRIIVEHAENWKADAIVLGAKGHSRLERFLLGSVSTAVAARAHCSVEVIRQRA